MAKYGHVRPQCYELGALKYDPNARVARGGYGDIYKGAHGNQTICVKVVAIPSGSEGERVVAELMKVSTHRHFNTRPYLLSLVDTLQGTHAVGPPFAPKYPTVLWSV